MRKGFMYINEEIKLDFTMHNNMRDIVNILDRAFEENDEDTWNCYWEVVGLVAKTEHACHRLTAEQMHAIWERYGTAG